MVAVHSLLQPGAVWSPFILLRVADTVECTSRGHTVSFVVNSNTFKSHNKTHYRLYFKEECYE